MKGGHWFKATRGRKRLRYQC